MRFEGKHRRTCVALLTLTVLGAIAALAVTQRSAPAAVASSGVASGLPAGAIPEAVGGRVWRSCALGIGMVIGGILGMEINPLGGAAAISIGGHMALFFCT